VTSRVLVTGGAGFIGSALVRRLLEEGHAVAVLDNFWRGSMHNLRTVNSHPSLTVIEGDATNSDELQRAFDALGGVDLVHHLAAINGTKWFNEAAIDVIDVNINGTLAALRKAMEWGARFVLASSPEAYGDNEQMPLHHEDTSVFPAASSHQRFSYGASKYLDEVALHHAVHQGLDARIVRPFNAYGADMLGDEYGQVVGMFFQAIRDQQPMSIHGNGTQTRSLTHIDDIVEGFFLAGSLDVGVDGSLLSGGSFNLGSREEVSMLELASTVNRIVGSLAVDCVLTGGYPGDSKRRLPNIESSQTALGWSPKITLDDGLEMVWEGLQTGP